MIRIQKALEKSASPQSFIVTDGSNEPTYQTLEQVKSLLGTSNDVVSFYDGVSTQSSDGVTLSFDILHNAPDEPTFVSITPATEDAAGFVRVTKTDTFITVYYETAPPVGTNNLVFNWFAVSVGSVGVSGGGGGANTDLGYSTGASTGTITSSTGTDATIPAATTGIAGLLTAADKTKLNGIATSANNYIHPNHTGEVTSTGDGATVITAGAVVNSKLANMAASTIKGSVAGGVPSDLTPTNVKTILALSASDITNVAAGNIAATTVQAAVNELDTEKNVNIQVQNAATNLGTSGTVNTLNFTGAGVVASRVGNAITVTVAGGGGGGSVFRGVNTQSSSGIATVFNIAHGIGSAPTSAVVNAASVDATGLFYTTFDSTNIIIRYLIAPAVGTNNLVFNWIAA